MACADTCQLFDRAPAVLSLAVTDPPCCPRTVLGATAMASAARSVAVGGGRMGISYRRTPSRLFRPNRTLMRLPSRAELAATTRLAMPIVLAQVGLMSMGVVDTVMVGRRSEERRVGKEWRS